MFWNVWCCHVCISHSQTKITLVDTKCITGILNPAAAKMTMAVYVLHMVIKEHAYVNVGLSFGRLVTVALLSRDTSYLAKVRNNVIGRLESRESQWSVSTISND